MGKEEIWKDIPNYIGYYQVSNMGRIRSVDRFVKVNVKTIFLKGKVKKQYKTKKGYLTINLSKDGVTNTMFVHVVVLTSFVQRPKGLNQINHKDENKTNNALTNLEYCDCKYNQNYGTCNLRKSLATINDIKRSKRVLQYTLDGQLIKEYPSLHQMVRDTGFSRTHIRSACNGKLHTAYGFKWNWE